MTAVTSTDDALPATAGTPDKSDQTRRRWVRVGHSWSADARAAGIAATADALGPPEPKLVMVFASIGYDLPELVAGVHSVADGVPTIGCSTSGEIGPGPALADGVVVVALGGEFSVTTTSAVGLTERSRWVGEEIGRGSLPLPDNRYQVTIMLTDALAGDQQEMIRGAYGVLGATVPLIGGGGGDSLGVLTSRQFHNGQIHQDAVVAATIGTDGPIGLSIRHGWQRHGTVMAVTRSEGNELFTLDDRPALDVYLDRHRAPEGLDANPAAFAEFGLTRPLAVARRGDVAVRHVLSGDPVTRSVTCAGSVPKGAAAWLATGDIASTLAAADAACADATQQLGDSALLGLLVFDCGGRRAVLGDDGVIAEHQVMHERAGTAPLAGFYTCGEIARTRGVHGFHNQTIVALALS